MATNALIKSSAIKDVIQTDAVKNRLKEIMGHRAPQFAAALVQIVNQSWQLQKCEPTSVIGAALTAAALDLSIDPNLGQAHIIPYGERAQFQIGYCGFAQLAQRSGQYKNLGWKVVHKGELVSYDELSGELDINSDHPTDEVIGYAAKFKLVNGFERAEYWTAEQIEAHALRYSKAYRAAKGDKKKEADCLWLTSRDRMALKTVLKSLLKIWGPKSIQMQKALRVDEGSIIDADAETVAYVDNEIVPDPVRPDFGGKKTEVETPPPPNPDPNYNMLKAVKGLIKSAGLKNEQVIDFLIEIGAVEEGEDVTLDTLPEDVLSQIHGQHEDMFKRIKGELI